jgi:hypothetical protein
MGQSGFNSIPYSFKSPSFNSSNHVSPTRSNVTLENESRPAQQCTNKNPAGLINLKCRPESPNNKNKCLAVGFAPKLVSNNCTKWILDSEATDHMTGNHFLLSNYRITKNDQFFTVANSEKIKMKGFGIISIFPKGFLQDVFLLKIVL